MTMYPFVLFTERRWGYSDAPKYTSGPLPGRIFGENVQNE